MKYLLPFETYSEWQKYWIIDSNRLTFIVVSGMEPTLSFLKYIPPYGIAVQIDAFNRQQAIAVGATRPSGPDFYITFDNDDWQVDASINPIDNYVNIPHVVLFALGKELNHGMTFYSMYAANIPEKWVKTPLVWIHRPETFLSDLMAAEISCGNCDAPSPAVRCGANCGTVLYCNQECADAHWEKHLCNE